MGIGDWAQSPIPKYLNTFKILINVFIYINLIYTFNIIL